MKDILKDLCDENVCLHDNEYTCKEVPQFSPEYTLNFPLHETEAKRYKIRQYTCKNCGCLFKEEKIDTDTGNSEILYMDYLYEVLYTRKGRSKLLKYLLQSIGVNRLPKCWSR